MFKLDQLKTGHFSKHGIMGGSRKLNYLAHSERLALIEDLQKPYKGKKNLRGKNKLQRKQNKNHNADELSAKQ